MTRLLAIPLLLGLLGLLGLGPVVAAVYLAVALNSHGTRPMPEVHDA